MSANPVASRASASQAAIRSAARRIAASLPARAASGCRAARRRVRVVGARRDLQRRHQEKELIARRPAFPGQGVSPGLGRARRRADLSAACSASARSDACRQRVAHRGQRAGATCGRGLEAFAGSCAVSSSSSAGSRVRKHGERVGKAVEHACIQDRQVGQRSKPRAQRQQVAGKVSAVDRRHVARRKRLQGLRVVPVIEVSAVPRRAAPWCERSRRPLDQRSGGDVTEIVGRQVREQAEADVGRRGAMRDQGARVFLEIVGRQPVVVLADKSRRRKPRSCARSCAGSGPGPQSGAASRRRKGRLSHQAMTGAATQSARTGRAAARAVGLVAASPTTPRPAAPGRPTSRGSWRRDCRAPAVPRTGSTPAGRGAQRACAIACAGRRPG